MILQIKKRITGEVIFEAEAESMRALVIAAIAAGKNLSRANLSRANLSGANLSEADLSEANLSGAYLSEADLSGANLSRAYLSRANLSEANLSEAYLSGADLSEANLSGADLSGAYLSEAIGFDATSASTEPVEKLPIPIIEDLPAKILEAIGKPGCRLEMSDVHQCETTHCIAGWSVHLAGAAGYALEKKHGWVLAANMIWHKSHKGPRPSFYGSNERALEQLRKCAGQSVAP